MKRRGKRKKVKKRKENGANYIFLGCSAAETQHGRRAEIKEKSISLLKHSNSMQNKFYIFLQVLSLLQNPSTQCGKKADRNNGGDEINLKRGVGVLF